MIRNTSEQRHRSDQQRDILAGRGNHTLPAETDKCLVSVDFALHPHMDHEWFPDNSMANLQKLAATLPMPSYAIDDQTALKVTNGGVEVLSEGNWKLFN